ncbi:MAG TPA: hypothetical protein VFX88_05245 [Actinomycetota bacterium]|jgi:hypothetical protein|nr:hypothetical protein [Actinomycetota bacterium]
MDEELFSELRTLQDVWNYVWSGYAVTIDARRRVVLGMRHDPRLPLAIAEPGALMTHAVSLAGPAGMTLQQLRELFDLLEPRRYERGLVQLRAGGDVVETTELRPDRAGRVQPQVVLRCR